MTKDDMEMDPVRRRILAQVKESRSNLGMASRAIGRSAAYLHQFIHRGTPRVLAENDREALAEHLGCSPEELRHDRSPSGDLQPRPPLAVSRDYCAAREIDVRAAAGPGVWNEEAERTKAIWILGERLIRHEFQARPEELRMITLGGDSMEPLASRGDRLLIDSSERDPVPPGIFVVWDGMGLVTKRIEHVPHSDPPRVRLKSANPEYDGYECPPTKSTSSGAPYGSRGGSEIPSKSNAACGWRPGYSGASASRA